MPIYQYECEDGHKFALIHNMDHSENGTTCLYEKCNNPLKRIYTPHNVTNKQKGEHNE